MRAWFIAQDSPQAILDGRFAADVLRGSPCIASTSGVVNTALLSNYFVRHRCVFNSVLNLGVLRSGGYCRRAGPVVLCFLCWPVCVCRVPMATC